MTPKTPVPARLFVLLARTAPVGVILRRGPSDWVQMIHWDMKKDVFTPGQWFHGRIYERKCDLSPNGQLLVYYAYKPGNYAANPEYADNWTAICKPPYFTALALWLHWNGLGGGGYFYKNNKMILNHLDDNRDYHFKHKPKRDLEIVEADEYSYMHDSVLGHRLGRDGWRPYKSNPRVGMPKISQLTMGKWQNVNGVWSIPDQQITTLTKSVKGFTLLCKVFLQHHMKYDRGIFRNPHYTRILAYKYAISAQSSTDEILLDDIPWADFDYRGRPVLTREGKLFSAAVVDGELALTELADFNANQPEAIESPAWAKRW